MRLLINASGTRATGATQVTVSFIKECIPHKENDYFIFLSQKVASELNIGEFPNNFRFYVFNYKPFFNSKGLKTWRRLIYLEKEIRPDCVFSVFGPSVWKPNAPHLMGYAYPYYIYPESPFFKVISFRIKFIISLHKAFHKYYLKRNGKYYVCETEDVASRLIKLLKCNPTNVFVVTNTFNSYFYDFSPQNRRYLPEPGSHEFRFITLSTFAIHKNLSILNRVIPILKSKLKDLDIRFILSIDESLLRQKMDVEIWNQFYCIGRIPVSDCPQAYFESDALFLPTLMECFSASYAEAMKLGKPIATSDLPFAHSVCNNAAIYFNPIDPNDIAEKLAILINDRRTRESLIEFGYKRLLDFDTPSIRAQKYLNICQKIVLKQA